MQANRFAITARRGWFNIFPEMQIRVLGGEEGIIGTFCSHVNDSSLSRF